MPVERPRTDGPASRRSSPWGPCGRLALRAWSAALDKIGIDANLHSLRHSFISAHAERDTPVVLVSDLVGHSRVTTTQTHYTRVRGGERQRIESLRSVL